MDTKEKIKYTYSSIKKYENNITFTPPNEYKDDTALLNNLSENQQLLLIKNNIENNIRYTKLNYEDIKFVFHIEKEKHNEELYGFSIKKINTS